MITPYGPIWRPTGDDGTKVAVEDIDPDVFNTANGLVKLDADGKIPVELLPEDMIEKEMLGQIMQELRKLNTQLALITDHETMEEDTI